LRTSPTTHSIFVATIHISNIASVIGFLIIAVVYRIRSNKSRLVCWR